jgi:hypothetical protein
LKLDNRNPLSEFLQTIQKPVNRAWADVRNMEKASSNNNGNDSFSTKRQHFQTMLKELKDKGLLPCILFIMSTTGAKKMFEEVLEHPLFTQQNFPIVQTCIDLLLKSQAYCKKFISNNELEDLIEGLKTGIGLHHGKLPPLYLRLVEFLFSNGYLQVVVSSASLAVGVNTPCKSIIVGSDSRFLDEILLQQMIGRAGRRGIEDMGHVIFFSLDEYRLRDMISCKLPEISGSMPLTISYILRLVLLVKSREYPVVEGDSVSQSVSKVLNTPLFVNNEDHFALLVLRVFQLANPEFYPTDLALIISHMFYTEPSNFILTYLLQQKFLPVDSNHELFLKYFFYTFSYSLEYVAARRVSKSDNKILNSTIPDGEQHNFRDDFKEEKDYFDFCEKVRDYNRTVQQLVEGFLQHRVRKELPDQTNTLSKHFFPLSKPQLGTETTVTLPHLSVDQGWLSATALLLGSSTANAIPSKDSWMINPELPFYTNIIPFAKYDVSIKTLSM